MSNQFRTMNGIDLILASIKPETYMSARDVGRLLRELESRHDAGGHLGKAIKRVRRSYAQLEVRK